MLRDKNTITDYYKAWDKFDPVIIILLIKKYIYLFLRIKKSKKLKKKNNMKSIKKQSMLDKCIIKVQKCVQRRRLWSKVAETIKQMFGA